MPDWGQLLGEFDQERRKGVPNFFDVVRRRHLTNLFRYTNRDFKLTHYHSARGQFLSTSGLRTRVRHLSPLDWVVIAIGIIGVIVATYLQTLRHP